MSKRYTFIANWKMALTYQDACVFVGENKESLESLSGHHAVVLCPDMGALATIAQQLKQTTIHVGAQDCSSHERGAYTGQTSLVSIKQMGVTHCLIGHSERRLYNGETDQTVGQKVSLALQHNVVPIVCIGESLAEYEAGKTEAVLERQLSAVFDHIKEEKGTQLRYVAYEPVWAIGTGKVPTVAALENIFDWLNNYCNDHSTGGWQLLYGGSVSEATIDGLHRLANVDGFLIGGASLNVQSFKKIVSYFP